MDARWDPTPLDSKRDIQVWLHPIAAFSEVVIGTETFPSNDAIDLTPFFSQGRHSMWEATLQFSWNFQLFGVAQPRPGELIEIRMQQGSVFQTLWVGVIESISNFTMSRGTRSMEVTARSRDSQPIWRDTKRATPLFPALTDLLYMVRVIAEAVGMLTEEIVVPPVSSITTAHTNTQLADMAAWDMLENLCVPMGQVPFINTLGQLKLASRDLMGRTADIEVETQRTVSIVASRNKMPTSRVRVKWLDPTLKKARQTGRNLVGEIPLTTGWMMPFIKKKVYFSDDHTQRAENTYLVVKHNPNNFGIAVCGIKYTQLTEQSGELKLTNRLFWPTLAAVAASWAAAHQVHDNVVILTTGDPITHIGATGITQPFGRRLEAVAQLSLMGMILAIGTGLFEIWGNPYELVHARNTTEAFDSSVPQWIDTPEDVESDFIMNETHAQTVAVRELVYRARAVNKWNVTIVDDARIEFGDICGFDDGSLLYVEDYNRELTKGSEAVLQLRGFLVNGNAVVQEPIAHNEEIPDSASTPGGGDGGGESGGGDELPNDAPNGFGTVQAVYNSRHWDLTETEEDAGRGTFTEAAVDALHAQDDRWGHIDKSPGQHQYNGHAVDAIIYKSPDGKTADIFDIITGDGGIQWGFVNRSAGNLGVWKYPA